MKRIFPLLYWVGLILALVGVGLRFWTGSLTWGLALAVVGVALLLAARLAQSVHHIAHRADRNPGRRGRPQ